MILIYSLEWNICFIKLWTNFGLNIKFNLNLYTVNTVLYSFRKFICDKVFIQNIFKVENLIFVTSFHIENCGKFKY